MKTLATVIAIMFIGFQTYASKLILTGNTPKPFSIQIAGNTYNSIHGQITISNLSAGFYHATIISIVKGRNKYPQTRMTTQNIEIPARATVFATVYQNNTMIVYNTEYQPIQKSQEYYKAPRVKETCSRNIEKEYHYNNAMSNYKFEELYNYLSQISFDSERVRETKKEIFENNFTSNQIYDLVNLFNFEDYRLEIAKIAYKNTIDQHNYYKIYELLVFQSSKNELDRFINRNEQNVYSYQAR